VAALVGPRLGGTVDPQRLPIVRVAVGKDDVALLVDGLDVAVRCPADGGAPVFCAFEDVPLVLAPRWRNPGPERTRARRGADEEAAVWIENRTSRTLALFWNQGDKETPYGEIAAGTVRRQHTFAGHRWHVIDGKGFATDFVAATEPAVVVVLEDGDPPRLREILGPPPPGPPTTGGGGGTRPGSGGGGSGPGRPSGGGTGPRSRPGEPRVENGELIVPAWNSGGPPLLRTPWPFGDCDVTKNDVQVGDDRLFVWRTQRSAIPDRLKLPGWAAHGAERRESVPYPRPGDARDVRRLQLFDRTTGKEIALDDALFRNPYDIREEAWSTDRRSYSFVAVERGHQAVRLVEIDAETGAVRALIEDAPPTFVDTAHAFYFQRFRSTDEALWMSERDGWRGLYLFDLKTGAQKARLTGDWVVDGVQRVDEKARQVWFRARGAHPGQDPYHLHFGRVDFDGKNLVWLTDADGTHEIEYSPDGSLYLDRWSRVDQPPVLELRRTADGAKVSELSRASDADLRAAGWQPPARFVAKATDGKTDLWGVVFRPSNFDPSKKYPVVEHVYAGPQGFFTPKAFDVWHHHRELAELGFIVVQLDAPGTAGRSKAFHDACWMNVADAGLKDRVAWIQALGAEHPECDLTRVGIYGTSAGGQTALRALLMHGDFYRAGVADCGCHDNRVDKQWWNEQWMGYPVGPHYAEQSNVVQAHRLTGDLLLMVGEVDTNVDPACTMQVVDALVKADKDFDLFVAPGVGHGVVGTPYGKRRLLDFFVRKLLKVEPRREA
jgi:dipeptidyl aminopeptidase/acylaminoacyl peptidase